MPGTVARNSNLPEELGRISYLLSDKTGTLTQNDMKFKRLVVIEQSYTDENLDDLRRSLQKVCSKYSGPLADLTEEELDGRKPYAARRRKNDFVIRDLITALAICHNVTPVYESGESFENGGGGGEA
jgi:phospholipid-translocating ATPase